MLQPHLLYDDFLQGRKMSFNKEKRAAIQGVLYVVVSAILFGINPSLQKIILLQGVTPMALIGISYSVVAVLSLGACRIRRENLRIEKQQIIQLLAMGAFGMGGTSFLLNTAYNYLPVGLVTILHFLCPTFVCVAMSLIFKEKFTWKKAVAILLSIGGLSLIQSTGSGYSATGVLIAIGSAITYAMYFILNERGISGNLSQQVKLFYIASGVATPYTLLAALAGNTFPPDSRTFLMNILVGIFYTFSIGFLNTGIRKIGAVKASFISILEPITSVLLSTILFSDQLGKETIIGCCLIISAILFITKE